VARSLSLLKTGSAADVGNVMHSILNSHSSINAARHAASNVRPDKTACMQPARRVVRDDVIAMPIANPTHQRRRPRTQVRSTRLFSQPTSMHHPSVKDDRPIAHSFTAAPSAATRKGQIHHATPSTSTSTERGLAPAVAAVETARARARSIRAPARTQRVGHAELAAATAIGLRAFAVPAARAELRRRVRARPVAVNQRPDA